jgi:hypothetical protein
MQSLCIVTASRGGFSLSICLYFDQGDRLERQLFGNGLQLVETVVGRLIRGQGYCK